MISQARKLTFGIYPGGAAGSDTGLLIGPPDNLAKVNSCLELLQGKVPALIVRCYEGFQDSDSPLRNSPSAPIDYASYARLPQRPIELVLQFRSASGDIDGYLGFVRSRIREHCDKLYAVQITEESNFTNGPDVIDGAYSSVLDALVAGVNAAKQTLRQLNRADVKVGFSVTPTFGPPADYWTRLRDAGNSDFTQQVDYVGLDFFPDTFVAMPLEKISGAVSGILRMLRNEWMTTAGLNDCVAIAITEHGWPTGPQRGFQRQVEVLEEVIRTIYEIGGELNIDRYTLFSLRDVDFATAENEMNIFNFFGITTADYTPKPAFEKYAELIERFGR